MHLSFNLLEGWIGRTYNNCPNFGKTVIALNKLENEMRKCQEELDEQKLKEKDDFILNG